MTMIMPIKKKCIVCKKDFCTSISTYKIRIYCSEYCRKREGVRRWRKRNPDKKRAIDSRYRLKHREENINYLKEWRAAKGYPWILMYNQAKKEMSRFGRLRKEVFERDNYKCHTCGGRKENLLVRHIDGQGVNVPAKKRNNKPENLITICRSCHNKINLDLEILSVNK